MIRSSRTSMFESFEESPRPWQLFVFHCCVVLFGVSLVGLFNYWITPIVGAVSGIRITRKLRDESALFAWIPASLLFAWNVHDAIVLWSPQWSKLTHWQYFINELFGHSLGTIFTAIFTGGLGYSLGAFFVLWRSRRISISN